MRPGDREAPSGSELIGLSGILAAAVLVPLLGGIALDSVLRTAPLFVMVGLGVGIAAAAVAVYTRLKRYL